MNLDDAQLKNFEKNLLEQCNKHQVHHDNDPVGYRNKDMLAVYKNIIEKLPV